jgi:predicted deacylase
MSDPYFEIADIRVAPGEWKYTQLPVARLLTNAELALPLHVLHGAEKGPVLGITSAVHGAEYHPIRMVKRALESIDVQELRGTILAVPICNPISFARGTRITPDEDDIDFGNLNRVFPGYRATALFGTGKPPTADRSLTERIASVLNDRFLPRIGYLIDFHCHAQELGLIKTISHKDESGEQGRLSGGMSRALGLGLIHQHGAGPTTITGRASEMGIATCVPEIGGGRLSAPAEDRALALGVRGILNVLKYLEMIDGELELPNRQLVFEVAPHVRPTTSGYLVSRFDPDELFLGDETGVPVNEGQVLGTVFNPYTFEETETLRATTDGILYIARRSGPISAGGHAYSVADFEQSHWID